MHMFGHITNITALMFVEIHALVDKMDVNNVMLTQEKIDVIHVWKDTLIML